MLAREGSFLFEIFFCTFKLFYKTKMFDLRKKNGLRLKPKAASDKYSWWQCFPPQPCGLLFFLPGSETAK